MSSSLSVKDFYNYSSLTNRLWTWENKVCLFHYKFVREARPDKREREDSQEELKTNAINMYSNESYEVYPRKLNGQMYTVLPYDLGLTNTQSKAIFVIVSISLNQIFRFYFCIWFATLDKCSDYMVSCQQQMGWIIYYAFTGEQSRKIIKNINYVFVFRCGFSTQL